MRSYTYPEQSFYDTSVYRYIYIYVYFLCRYFFSWCPFAFGLFLQCKWTQTLAHFLIHCSYFTVASNFSSAGVLILVIIQGQSGVQHASPCSPYLLYYMLSVFVDPDTFLQRLPAQSFLTRQDGFWHLLHWCVNPIFIQVQTGAYCMLFIARLSHYPRCRLFWRIQLLSSSIYVTIVW